MFRIVLTTTIVDLCD